MELRVCIPILCRSFHDGPFTHNLIVAILTSPTFFGPDLKLSLACSSLLLEYFKLPLFEDSLLKFECLLLCFEYKNLFDAICWFTCAPVQNDTNREKIIL